MMNNLPRIIQQQQQSNTPLPSLRSTLQPVLTAATIPPPVPFRSSLGQLMYKHNMHLMQSMKRQREEQVQTPVTSSPPPVQQDKLLGLLELMESSSPIAQKRKLSPEPLPPQQQEVAAKPAKQVKKIPRPPNAFMLYRRDRHAILKQGPGLKTVPEISKIVGQMWREETAEVKQRYFDLASEADAEHRKKFPQYKYAPKKK